MTGAELARSSFNLISRGREIAYTHIRSEPVCLFNIEQITCCKCNLTFSTCPDNQAVSVDLLKSYVASV